MAKRIILLLLASLLAFTIAACGNSGTQDDTNNTNQQGSDNSMENDKIDNNVNVNLSQVLTFMGYNISYPGDASKNPSDYGNLVGDSNYILIVEAPSIAGNVFDIANIADVPAACEEYIARTLEHKMRSVFDDGSTSQKINKSEEVTYNGIKMLMTEGTFTNDRNGTTVEFSAIYLLAGDNVNRPVYIVGVPMNDGFDVASIVEAVAQNIRKSNISFTQSETVLGYTIMCPENCSVSNSKYGKAFSYGSDFSVIIEAPAAVGNVFSVSSIEEAVSSCEEYVCASLESRNTDIFHTGATTQIITEKKTIRVAGNDALKVVGTFKNTRDNIEINYVAYYLLATSSEGASYPIYIVGINLDGSASDLSAFIDDMASHIKNN